MSEALKKAQQAMAARRASGEEIVRLSPIEKARAKPSSLRLAVNGKCADCIGWDADPNPRQRIRDCSVASCTLNAARPYQRGESDDIEQEG